METQAEKKGRKGFESYFKQFGSGQDLAGRRRAKVIPSSYSYTAAQRTPSQKNSSVEERMIKDLKDHYNGLEKLRSRFHDLMLREQAIKHYCDFMADCCDRFDTDHDTEDSSSSSDSDEYLDLKEPAPPVNVKQSKGVSKREGYTFFTNDSDGVHYKSMDTKDGVPFRIEIDVTGFAPRDIHVDTLENEMTVTMKQKPGTRPTAGPVKLLQKTLGIICPTTEDLDKLNIHYPTENMLLIEGPTSVPKVRVAKTTY